MLFTLSLVHERDLPKRVKVGINTAFIIFTEYYVAFSFAGNERQTAKSLPFLRFYGAQKIAVG